MFDISWSEFLLIGVVALVVIGPKELPTVMRTLGQWTRKVRGMATEFQNQFQEAMREAEMTDLKKEVDNLADDVKRFDPLKDMRDDFQSIGEGVKESLAANPETTVALPAAGTEPAPAPISAETPVAALETISTPAADVPTPAPALPDTAAEPPARELEPIGARPEAGRVDPADRPVKAEQADATGRTG
jgi:sec-independent protein translocase protein TatB